MSDTTERMSRVLDEAVRMVSEKNVTYQDAWREHGWRGSLGKVLTKSARLRNMLWRSNNGLMNGERETPRETALDMINHLVFMVMNMDEGREWGHELNPIHTPMNVDNQDWNLGADPAGWTPENNRLMEGATQTEISPHVGNASPTPTPQPRRGSGPRKIKDAPQA